MKKINHIIIFLSVFCANCTGDWQKNNTKEFELTERSDSSDKALSYYNKFKELNENSIEKDSTYSKQLMDLSYKLSKLKDFAKFKEVNQFSKKYFTKLKDGSKVAYLNWDLADFYNKTGIKDSAFFFYSKSQKYFETEKEYNISGKLLLNLAILSKNNRDYTGSEILTYNSIANLEKSASNKQLYRAYNNIGILSSELEEYDKALKNYKKANEYLIKSKNTKLLSSLNNNIGIVFLRKENYSEALEYFLSAEKNYLKNQLDDVVLRAILIDNIAYCKLNLGIKNTYSKLHKALNIRKVNNIYLGIPTSHLHLSEYFLNKKDTVKAIKHLEQAHDISKEYNIYDDQLKSLYQLASVDKLNSDSYYESYIKLNKDLNARDRKTREKFTKIRFETDNFKIKNSELNKRFNSTLLYSTIILLGLILVIIVILQRSKNRRLILNQEKQKYAQEVYNLILKQKDTFEKGREEAQLKISRELHDGILGRIFGIRLSLDSLNDDTSEDGINFRQKYIDDIKKVAEDIRQVSHQLNITTDTNADFNSVLKALVYSNEQSTINFDIDDNVIWNEINEKTKINIYRILQESLLNVHKHSNASKCKVLIENNTERFTIYIKDNGNGMSKSNSAKTGIGLKNIKSRIKDIDGKIRFYNGKNSWTGLNIEIHIPK